MSVPARSVYGKTDVARSRLRELRWTFRRLAGEWVVTNPMRVARRGHTATLLADGSVLVVGGSIGGLHVELHTAECERFDRRAASFERTGALKIGRTDHVALTMADSSVLVVGGLGDDGASVSAAERYDPQTGTWHPAGEMHSPRVGHSCSVLADGTVLVVGGYDRATDSVLHTAEVYDPATGEWSMTASMSEPRSLASATPLPGGTVLVAGGYNTAAPSGLASCEVYQPDRRQWVTTGTLRLPRDNEETGGHRTARLDDGRVLVVGGHDWGIGQYMTSCEIYDPGGGGWTDAAPMHSARGAGVAATLHDGTVLVVGGYNDGVGSLASVERYLPARNEWRTMRPMGEARGGFTTLTALSGGQVLVTGGDGAPPSFRPLANAEMLRL